MRKTIWFVVVLFCVIAVAILALEFFGSLRDRQIAARGPITLEDLDRIAMDLNLKAGDNPQPHAPGSAVAPPSVQNGQEKESQTAGAQPQETEKAGIGDAAQPLPKRLVRATTPEERELLQRTVEAALVVAPLIDAGLGAIGVVALWAGRDEGAAWERAQFALMTRDWTAAHQHFQESLEKSPNPKERRYACAYLAWLEDDPELAVRYMEIACSDGNDACIQMAFYLARTTGSMELTDHYRARLIDVVRRRGEDVQAYFH